MEIYVWVRNSTSGNIIEGDIFSVYVRGENGDFYQALLSREPPKESLVAYFPPSLFPPGKYFFGLRAEQFLDTKPWDRPSFQVEKVMDKDGTIALTERSFPKSLIESDLKLNRLPHFPVCDTGGENISFGSSDESSTRVTLFDMGPRPEGVFSVYYENKAEQPLASLGPCGIVDFKNFHPGGYFNTTTCNGLSSFCCSNVIDGWDLMYRKNNCCFRMVDNAMMKDLKASHRILFAGDSTINYLLQHGSILWPSFPEVDTSVSPHVLKNTSFIDFIWIANPFRNSLKNIVDDASRGVGEKFWKKVKDATIIVIHSCAHDVSPLRGKTTRKRPLSEYKNRMESLATLLNERAPGKKVFWVSCGTQSFKNVGASKEFWACQKQKTNNCEGDEIGSLTNACYRYIPDVSNYGWALDVIAHETIKEHENIHFVDVHTLGDVAKADLNLFPHVEPGKSCDLRLSGDIHLSKGRGVAEYAGWLYSLKMQLIMSHIKSILG